MRAVQARRVPRVAVLFVAAAVVTALATPVASSGSSSATAAEAPAAAVGGDGTALPSPLPGAADNGVRDGAVAGPATPRAPTVPTPAPAAAAAGPLLSVDPRSTVDVQAGAVVPAVSGVGTGVVAPGSGAGSFVSGAGSVTPAAGANDIPARVLTAYQQAATLLATDDPSCRITWQDVAGIGKVESDHARAGRVDANGVTITPILGPVLDGGGFAAIRDSDGGVLDGNATWDRAVGPMQFIPASWKAWGADADGDGTANPHDVDDAALGTARYLCAGSRDLSTSAGLAQGIYSYNHSAAYVQLVVSWIRRYTDGGAVGVGEPVDLPVIPVGPPVRDPAPRGGPDPVVTTSPAPVPVVAPSTAPTPGPLPTPVPSAAPVPTTRPVPVPTAKPSPTRVPVPTSPSSPTPGPRPTPVPTPPTPVPTPPTPVPTPPTPVPTPPTPVPTPPTPAPDPTRAPVPPPTVGPLPTPRPPLITAPAMTPAPTVPSPTPTGTPTPSPTPTGTPTPSPTPTGTPTPSPTPTGTPTPSPTPTGTATASPSGTASGGPGPSPDEFAAQSATDPAREPS